MTPPTIAPRCWAALVACAAIVMVAACLPPSSRTGATGEPGGSAGTSLESAAATPSGPTPRPSIVRPTPTPAPTFAVYKVAPGDSLTSIARRFGTTGRSIAFWNRATYPSLDPDSSAYRPNVLKVGWTLNIIPNVVVIDDEAPPLPSPSGDPAPS